MNKIMEIEQVKGKERERTETESERNILIFITLLMHGICSASMISSQHVVLTFKKTYVSFVLLL